MTIARDFTTRLADLLRRERTAMADFLVALAEFDRQKLWLELGHASLFSFLRRELGLSAGAAQYRKTAAELVRRFADVEAGLREGRLCLSSVCELSKVITAENCADVLPRFFGLSAREAAAVAVSIRPVADPPRRDVVTSLRPVTRLAADAGMAAPERAREPSGGTSPGGADSNAGASAPPFRTSETNETASSPFRTSETNETASSPFRTSETNETASPAVRTSEMNETASLAFRTSETPVAALALVPAPRSAAPPPTAFTVEPLDAELSRLHFTVSRRFLAKLEATRDALSHSHAGASTEEILEACMDAVLAQSARRKGLVAKPRTAPSKATASGATTSRAIPAAVKRAAWQRAGGRCEWPLDGGGVCGSTVRLEFDHVKPVALGGVSTIDNIKVHCRPHNQHAARLVFGDDWMDRFSRPRSRSG